MCPLLVSVLAVAATLLVTMSVKEIYKGESKVDQPSFV